ncbi:MAG: hypothetical protein NXH85_12145 [Pseudomonadaceae bacterium]|nr:hypothetical protein [Pseudomonadaceae bacterium]
MNTWKALIKREWLEHRGGYLWAPIAIAIVIALVLILGLTVGDIRLADFADQARDATTEQHGDEVPLGERIDERLQEIAQDKDASGRKFHRGLFEVGKPFAVCFFIVTFFVLLATLYDERKDRTALFWKAMPVRDRDTVLSKLIMPVWIAPLVSVAAIVLAQVFVLIALSILLWGNGHITTGDIWWHAGLLRGAFEWLATFATWGFWSLPVWSYLLLVSSVAPKAPFLWAVMSPLVVAAIEWATFGSHHVLRFISGHMVTDATVVVTDNPNAGTSIYANLGSLWASGSMWFGIALGVVMLVAAVYFRRRYSEV